MVHIKRFCGNIASLSYVSKNNMMNVKILWKFLSGDDFKEQVSYVAIKLLKIRSLDEESVFLIEFEVIRFQLSCFKEQLLMILLEWLLLSLMIIGKDYFSYVVIFIYEQSLHFVLLLHCIIVIKIFLNCLFTYFERIQLLFNIKIVKLNLNRFFVFI